MVNKCIRKCSTSLAFREMQIKTTLRFHLTPTRMAFIQNFKQQQMLARLWRNWNFNPLLVGLQISTTTLEKSMEDPQKMGTNLPYDTAIPLLGIYPKGQKPNYQTIPCTSIFIAAQLPNYGTSQDIHQQMNGSQNYGKCYTMEIY